MSARSRRRSSRISKADIARLQAHLRATLDCAKLHLDPPSLPSGTVQLRIGAETIGTLDQVEEEGERSWVATLIVLPEDLPAG